MGNPNGVILMVTGPISVISSMIIVIMILRSRVKLSNSYHRLIFGISLTDIMLSSGLSFSSLPAPIGTPDTWKSLGNRSTCNAQGFFIMFGTLATPAYFLSLQIYYLCKIKYHTNSEKMEKVELFLHVVPILLGLTGSIIPLVTDSMNPGSRGYCWLQDFPLHCTENQNVECTRGMNYMLQHNVLSSTSLLTSTAIFVVMWMIYASVRKQDTKNATHNFVVQPPQQSHQQRRSQHRRSFIRSQEDIMNAQYEKSRKTRRRIMHYFYAYLCTYLFPYIDAILRKVQSIDNLLQILYMCFYPLWGFFNLVVFILPAVNKAQARNAELSLPRAFFTAIISYVGPSTADARRRSSVTVRSPNSLQDLNRTVLSLSSSNDVANCE